MRYAPVLAALMLALTGCKLQGDLGFQPHDIGNPIVDAKAGHVASEVKKGGTMLGDINIESESGAVGLYLLADKVVEEHAWVMRLALWVGLGLGLGGMTAGVVLVLALAGRAGGRRR